ncbi:MAG: hypothetical protein WCD65_17055, partial [Pseudolabrys sp.]
MRFSAIECILRYYIAIQKQVYSYAQPTVFRAIVFIEELSTPDGGILNGQTNHSFGDIGAARAPRDQG